MTRYCNNCKKDVTLSNYSGRKLDAEEKTHIFQCSVCSHIIDIDDPRNKVGVHILWGESPEADADPSKYEFATQAEMTAFIYGVSEAEGWMGYEIIEPKADGSLPSTKEILHNNGKCEDGCEFCAAEEKGDKEDEDADLFTNYFVHHGQVWSDNWSCMCNDDCPGCGHEIEPFMSVNNYEPGQIMHVQPDFVPENGWPEGITTLEELKAYALENC